MSFNFNNSLSGSAAGNNLGNLNGSYQFAPTYTASNGATTVTPSFGRAGNVSNFSTNSGVNTAGVTVGHQVTPSTNVYAGASASSNGQHSVGAGVKFNF